LSPFKHISSRSIAPLCLHQRLLLSSSPLSPFNQLVSVRAIMHISLFGSRDNNTQPLLPPAPPSTRTVLTPPPLLSIPLPPYFVTLPARPFSSVRQFQSATLTVPSSLRLGYFVHPGSTSLTNTFQTDFTPFPLPFFSGPEFSPSHQHVSPPTTSCLTLFLATLCPPLSLPSQYLHDSSSCPLFRSLPRPINVVAYQLFHSSSFTGETSVAFTSPLPLLRSA